ncbi:hypothetical protein D9757_001380 [Collybiopsis confluens]|uniref:Transmembrane protein n=1 Tax=Collybiopsis confluens TaxID=2823264 RepID=A0A8H5HZJ4_9AGAR|nr:hypothetical protein D9757_001380 [Collybiopsis confluens]
MKGPALLVLALVTAGHSVAAVIPTFTPITSPATPPSTASSSAAPAEPSGVPVFQFLELPTTDISTCSTNYVVTWSWGADGAFPTQAFTLSVTNINVTQSGPPAVASASASSSQIIHPITDLRRQVIPSVASGSVLSTGTVSAPSGSSSSLPGLLESLTTSLDPRVQNIFTWGIVNLPQGWYRFMATATDGGDTDAGVGGIWSTFNATSDSFFIRNGTDTSCLVSIVASTSDGASSGAVPTSTASTAGQSSPSSVGSISSSSHVNSGAIAGGVVGGIVAIVAVLVACLLYRQRRQRSGASGIDGTDTDHPPRPVSENGELWAHLIRPMAPNPVTALNTSVNGRPQKSGGFGLGDMGLAALGLAKPQQNAPSTYSPKSQRHRQWSKHNSTATAESAGAMMSSSFSSSEFSPASSAHGHFDPYRAEESSPYEKDVPMRDLSPTSSPVREEYLQYQPYISSLDSFGSGAPGAEAIPAGYEPSPFATPPPSQPASRHNSRSYSNQTFAALGPADFYSSAAVRTGRVRSRSQSSNSPTSTRPAMEVPSVPRSPMSHQKRASSPDALVYTLDGRNREQLQAGSSGGSKGPTKRTARKPVPSYTPEDSPVDAPLSPVYMYSGTTIAGHRKDELLLRHLFHPVPLRLHCLLPRNHGHRAIPWNIRIPPIRLPH